MRLDLSNRLPFKVDVGGITIQPFRTIYKDVPDKLDVDGTLITQVMLEAKVRLWEVISQLHMTNDRYYIQTVHTEYGHRIYVSDDHKALLGVFYIEVIYGDPEKSPEAPPSSGPGNG
jgi:hypothetical protein